MPNPVFNEDAVQSGVAEPERLGRPAAGTHVAPVPVTDGPVSSWQKAMTINGTITASAVLLVHPARRGGVRLERRHRPDRPIPDGRRSTPTSSRPSASSASSSASSPSSSRCASRRSPSSSARCTPSPTASSSAPSRRATRRSTTASCSRPCWPPPRVFAVMLVLYRTRIIKVTDKFRRAVIFATLGVMVLYLVSFIFSLFGGSLPFLNGDNMPMSIGFSVFVCGLAAMNLALDFDFIERATNVGDAEGLRVGRRPRPGRHPRVAVPRDPAPALVAAQLIDRSTPASMSADDGGSLARGCRRRRVRRRPRGPRRLAGSASAVPVGVVAAANGAVSRLAARLRLAAPKGCAAVVLDSTWALPMTAAALFAHAVGAAHARWVRRRPQPACQPPRVPARLPAAARLRHHDRQRHQRRRRHVQAPPARADHRSRGRPRVAGPAVGPLYPVVYVGWMVGAGAVGVAAGRPVTARHRSARSSRRTRTTSTRSSGGLQPRRPLAAGRQGRRHRLEAACRPPAHSVRDDRYPA